MKLSKDTAHPRHDFQQQESVASRVIKVLDALSGEEVLFTIELAERVGTRVKKIREEVASLSALKPYRFRIPPGWSATGTDGQKVYSGIIWGNKKCIQALHERVEKENGHEGTSG